MLGAIASAASPLMPATSPPLSQPPPLLGAIASSASPLLPPHVRLPLPPLPQPLHFVTDASAAIQFNLLQPPLPILWASNELVLFEDELHDCGACKLALKARVMPDCWFVLLRFTLRVDRVMIRVRDVRVFHAFGAECIVRDTQLREHSWSDLAALGLPEDPAFFAANLERVIERVPVRVKRTESLQLLTNL